MKVYENTRSREKPKDIVTDEYSVWVYKNIHTTSDIIDDIEQKEYEYTMIQYSKDEYIKMLHDQVTDTELALTEIYEEMFANG